MGLTENNHHFFKDPGEPVVGDNFDGRPHVMSEGLRLGLGSNADPLLERLRAVHKQPRSDLVKVDDSRYPPVMLPRWGTW